MIIGEWEKGTVCISFLFLDKKFLVLVIRNLSDTPELPLSFLSRSPKDSLAVWKSAFLRSGTQVGSLVMKCRFGGRSHSPQPLWDTVRVTWPTLLSTAPPAGAPGETPAPSPSSLCCSLFDSLSPILSPHQHSLQIFRRRRSIGLQRKVLEKVGNCPTGARDWGAASWPLKS